MKIGSNDVKHRIRLIKEIIRYKIKLLVGLDRDTFRRRDYLLGRCSGLGCIIRCKINISLPHKDKIPYVLHVKI